MNLFALRVLAFGVLMALYAINPWIGVVALASGFGYAIRQRVRDRPRPQ